MATNHFQPAFHRTARALESVRNFGVGATFHAQRNDVLERRIVEALNKQVSTHIPPLLVVVPMAMVHSAGRNDQ